MSSQTTETPVYHEEAEYALEFLQDYYRNDILQLAEGFPGDAVALCIEYADIEQFDPALADDVTDHYEKTVAVFEEALSRFDLPVDTDLSGARCRVHNLPEYLEVNISSIRSDHVGRFLPIKGIVSRKTQVQSRIVELPYYCNSCGAEVSIPQLGGDLQQPGRCDCGANIWVPEDSKAEAIDAQTVDLQEPPEVADDVNGAMISGSLREDLTGMTIEGERITANAVVRVDMEDLSGRGSASRDRSFYLDIKSIDKHETQFTDIEISDEDERELQALSNESDLYDRLMGSLAPWITTHGKLEILKLAIILQLFGGVEHELPNGDTLRGDIHVYLIGDAGTAKTQLGRAAKEIAPLGMYASGKGATPAGMTATATETADGWELDAGALVVANGGFAFVDEFDKMDSTVHQSMHEALENQEIPISKAGINTVLTAKTTVLAASNPEGGEVNRYDSIAEQVNIERPLLSRFDLVYLLYDDPDEAKDREIATHQHDVADRDAADVKLDIDVETLRKYIAYARENVSPEYASSAVKDALVDMYVEMRQHNADEADAPTPVTARVNDSLRRLAQASARARLSDDITLEDIDRVERLLKASLGDTAFREDGTMDAIKSEGGSRTPETRRERHDAILASIEHLQDDFEDRAGVPRDALLDHAAEEHGVEHEKTGHAIESLKRDGTVYEPETEVYRVA